jgi:NAD(P)-dependent dehydrogenase (short-subunit alcohol dehydrogenase family)
MKRYLITGSTSGIGKAVTIALNAHAATEVIVVGRTMEKLRFLFEECPSQDPVYHEMLDMSADPYAISTMIRDWAKDAGPLDGIFHAAGEELVAPLRMTGDDSYRRAMVFADSAFAVLRAAATPGVMAEGGSVVIMSSVAAHRGTAAMSAYSGARAAAEAMVRCAATELAPRGVRVNCVAAGAFESPMHERLMRRQPEEARAAYARKHPLGIGSVDAVRDAVLYLLSDAARWTTGTTMVVDGGYLAA